jgi:tetratricopeptide (TPR) repeat protein
MNRSNHQTEGELGVDAFCEAEPETLRYYAGELEGEAHERAERHVVECDTCRETIAMLARATAEDLSPEDARLRDEVAARTADAARRLFEAERQGPRVPAWVYAVAASVLIAVGVWFAIPRPDPDVELAMTTLRDATRERRPAELQVTGLDYAPYREVRGAGGDDRVAVARDLLLEAVDEDPSPEARHALGRALIASREYAGAVAQLELAAAEAPSDAAVLTDLAVARAAAGDAERATEALDRALTADPDFAPALFNRGMLAARAGRRDAARADLQRYLTLDGASEWAAEARQRLQTIDSTVP